MESGDHNSGYRIVCFADYRFVVYCAQHLPHYVFIYKEESQFQ